MDAILQQVELGLRRFLRGGDERDDAGQDLHMVRVAPLAGHGILDAAIERLRRTQAALRGEDDVGMARAQPLPGVG
ncbi:hypothetical protein G6F22_015769 [Rhizopus arrhizus]|nr:hypothetical protein G6F22_015769 [Rhizopus arrhizus]KAG1166898.1 hypothetical protein G6F35_017929 [Rhizopus arrhizus]